MSFRMSGSGVSSTGRWQRSGPHIVLDVGSGTAAQQQGMQMRLRSSSERPPVPWAFLLDSEESSNSALESEIALPVSVTVQLTWTGPLHLRVVNGQVQGPRVTQKKGIYVICRPPPSDGRAVKTSDWTINYLGHENDTARRFHNVRYGVLREFRVPDFEFRVYTATAKVIRGEWKQPFRRGAGLNGRPEEGEEIGDEYAARLLGEAGLLESLRQSGHRPQGNIGRGETVTRAIGGVKSITLTVESQLAPSVSGSSVNELPPGLPDSAVIPIPIEPPRVPTAARSTRRAPSPRTPPSGVR